MISSGEELHPNWRALATVHLPLKRFIKEGEGKDRLSKSHGEKEYIINGVEGAEAKEFYEQLLADKSDPAVLHLKSKSIRASITAPSKKAVTKLPFERTKFFRCAQDNDVSGLKRFQLHASALNDCDEFGWTALMVAACAGALDSIKVLLHLGADRTIRDKSGNTALDLARRKSCKDIVKLLENNGVSVAEHQVTSNNCKEKSVKAPESFYCEICQRNFTDTSIISHQTSTVHNFNLNSTKPSNKLERFNIPNKNRGLQLMVKQGWDKESGLGPAQTGRLYPVKTVIRNKRSGIGIDQPPARVTHFKPYDLRATQRRPSDYYQKKAPNRNDIRREKVREWKRNRRLRNELS